MAKSYDLNIEINASDSLDKQVEQLRLMVEYKEQLKGELVATPDSDIKGIAETTKAIQSLIANINDLSKAIENKIKKENESGDSSDRNKKKTTELTLEMMRQRVVREQQTKALKDEAKALDLVEGSINEAIAANAKLRNELQNLNLKTVEGVQKAKMFRDQINENTKFIKENSDTLKQQSLNVGNYGGKFDDLSHNINQVTREFPAFAYGAQTGIAALSNNIPMLVDSIVKARLEIRELNKEGKETPTLFDRIKTSIFSWQTILSGVITILVFFGKEITNFVVELFEAEKAIKMSTESLGTYYNIKKKLLEESLKVNLNYNVAMKRMTQEEADDALRNYELRQSLLEKDVEFKKLALKQAKDFGLDLKDVYDENNKKIKLLPTNYEEYAKIANDLDLRGKLSSKVGIGKSMEEVFKETEKFNQLLIVLDSEFRKMKAKEFDIAEKERAIAADKAADKKVKEEKELNSKIIEEAQKLQYELNIIITNGELEKIQVQYDNDFKRLQLIYDNDKKEVAQSKRTQEEKTEELARIEIAWTSVQENLIRERNEKIYDLEIKAIDERIKASQEAFKKGAEEQKKEFEKEQKDIKTKEENHTKFILEGLKLEAQVANDKKKMNDANFHKEIEDLNKLHQDKIISYEEYSDRYDLLKKKRDEENKKIDQKNLDDMVNRTSIAFDRILVAYNESKKREAAREQKNLDESITRQDSNIEYQRQRAIAGQKNTLEYEQRKLVELEVERNEAAKKEERRLKRIAMLQLLAGYAKTDSQTAFQNALRDIGLTEGTMAVFAEKGGVAGNVKDTTMITGDKLSRTHGGGNDVLAVLDKREGVITKNRMDKLGGETGFNELMKSIDKGTFFNDIEIAKTPTNNRNDSNNRLIGEVRELQNIIKNKKEIDVNVDEYGNVIRRESQNAYIKAVKKIRERPRF